MSALGAAAGVCACAAPALGAARGQRCEVAAGRLLSELGKIGAPPRCPGRNPNSGGGDMKVCLYSIVLVTMIGLGAGQSRANGANDGAQTTILDLLAPATPTDTFSVFGSSGYPLTEVNLAGPQFTLAEPTVITEIGALVNNCEAFSLGVPECPDELLPTVAQIRPSLNGAHDTSTVLAELVLTDDKQVSLYSFESVTTSLLLDPGDYFVLFAAQNGNGGTLVANAEDPFNYTAGIATLGLLDTAAGTTTTSANQSVAVRILGTTPPACHHRCKRKGHRRFDRFDDEHDCVKDERGDR